MIQYMYNLLMDGDNMKWASVREIYPNQFVKIEVLNSKIENGKEYVNEVAVIEPIDNLMATKELLQSKNNILVYHTSNEKIILNIRSRGNMRRVQ